MEYCAGDARESLVYLLTYGKTQPTRSIKTRRYFIKKHHSDYFFANHWIYELYLYYCIHQKVSNMTGPIIADNDDFDSYSDEKIAAYLLSLQEQSLDDLLKAQMKIAEEYANATQAYEAERTEIRWARRKYWALIFVGVFKEIWRILIKGKESKISRLKQRRADLKEHYQEQDEAYHTQLSLVQDSIETIKLYSNEVSKRTKELADLKAVIEGLDAILLKLESGKPEDRLELEQQLAQHIEDREILNGYINDLSNKTEGLVNGLAGLLDNFSPDYVPKDFLSGQREANLEKIADLKERCIEVDHPIIPKLVAFLSRQTHVSLQTLQAEISKDKTIFKDRTVGDIVWEANTLYPAIFLGKNREQLLFDYMALQEQELVTLQEVIESTDVKLHAEDSIERRNLLDQMILDRDKLSSEISHLLLLHRHVLSGNHSELLNRVHALARQQSDGVKVSELKRLCMRSKHPMTKALAYFLTYRTDVSLKALKSVMAQDPSYLESRDLVRLIDDAGSLDERITEGWVKEVELPSIKDIQQHHMNIVADRLAMFNAQYDRLTDQRVAMAVEMHSLEESLRELDKEYTGMTGQGIKSYLPRAELDRIKKDRRRFQDFEAIRADYQAVAANLGARKKALATLNQEIEAVEKAQESCVVEPVLFTPEVLQSLIEKCKHATRLGRMHPVAAALGAFLNYPTPSLLTKLKFAMQEHGDYQKNLKIVQLLTEANHYFPYIQPSAHATKAHGFEFFQEYQGEVAHDEDDEPKKKPTLG